MDFSTVFSIEKGEEVCISYIDIATGLMSRRSNLLDKYFFHCTCQRCDHQEKHPEGPDIYGAYWTGETLPAPTEAPPPVPDFPVPAEAV